MKKLYRPLFYLIATLPSGIALFVFGYLGSFTRFIADDYCSAYYAKELGLFSSILFSYRTINGRYSVYGIDWIVLNLIDAYHIGWVPPLALVIWTIAAFLAIYSLLSTQKKPRDIVWHALLVAVIALFLILLLGPNINQSLYWWNGMRAYAFPLIVLTFWISILLWMRKKMTSKQRMVAGAFLSFLLFFLSGGLSETYLVMQLSLLLFLAFLKVLHERKVSIDRDMLLILAGILGTFLSLSIVLHSHANVIRRSVMPATPDLRTLTTISVDSYLIFLKNILFQREKVLALLGSFFMMIWLGKRYSPKMGIWFVPLLFFGAFLLLLGSCLPGVYGYVQFPPTRTLIIGVFMFVVFLLCASFLLGNWLSEHNKFPYRGRIIAILAILFLLTSSAITTHTLYNSRHIYIDFAEKWDRVDAEILEAKAAGAPSITTEAMNNWARLDRPNENPKWWPTRCYSLYYDFLVMGPPYGN